MGLAQEIRSRHRLEVLWATYRAGAISRAELSRRLGLTKPSISAIVGDLLASGLLRENGRGQVGPRGGRAPVFLEVDPRARVALGIDVRRDKLTVILADLRGALVARAVEPASPEVSAEAVVDQVVRVCRTVLRRTRTPRSRLLGVGIGTIGPVDAAEGVVRQPLHFARGADIPFRARLEAAFGVPVVVDVGSNAAAFGEMTLGAARDRHSLVYITLGYGIGSGIVLNGHIHRSLASFGLGHTSVDPDGPACSCGNRGCLELYAATDAVASRIRQHVQQPGADPPLPDGADGDAIYAWLAGQIRQGEESAAALVGDLAARIFVAIRNLVNLIGPELLVIGSSHPHLVDLVFPALAEHIAALNACQPHRRQLEVRPASLKENSIALGAAMMVIHRFLRGADGIAVGDEGPRQADHAGRPYQ